MAFEPEDVTQQSASETRYVNYLQVGHTAREIILEFGQFHKGDAAPVIYSRLITHPAYAEDFLLILTQALRDVADSEDRTQ